MFQENQIFAKPLGIYGVCLLNLNVVLCGHKSGGYLGPGHWLGKG